MLLAFTRSRTMDYFVRASSEQFFIVFPADFVMGIWQKWFTTLPL